MSLRELYRPSLALLTDLYQLTMAYGYWKLGRAEWEAVFHLSFREIPFKGGYAVACGLGLVIDLLSDFRFEAQDLEYLASLRGNDDRPLFDGGFIEYLANLRLTCDLDAIPEGTPVFPHEPLIRVRGPILQAQLIETPLLTLTNFSTLIATRAARLCDAAGGDPVIDFGLRRAQGFDGAITAARAAFIGGCAGTSNVLAGRLLDIPVKGTHAHSWVMAFDDETAAFDRYAEALPNNATLLVDTYNTLQGVRHAIEAGRRLRERGHRLAGIRLDSGDLAYLSIEARALLDEAGFTDTAIVASNDLDEHLVTSLKQQGARIDIWGVGTRLITAYEQPALGGIYKLSALRPPGGEWQHKIKLSEQLVKVSIPGILQVRRFHNGKGWIGDMIWDELTGLSMPLAIIDPGDPTRGKRISARAGYEDLLIPVFREGRLVYDSPSLPELQARTRSQVVQLHPTIRRLDNPHAYPAGLEKGLHALRTELVLQARNL